MTIRTTFKMALAIFGLLLTLNTGASAQKVDCSKMTDADIVKSIYDKIAVKYEAQIIHINVTITDGVVKLDGWATTKNVRKDIKKYAKKMKCVKKVTNNLTIGVGGGCGPGSKTCGGICIPSTDTCNICTARTCN